MFQNSNKNNVKSVKIDEVKSVKIKEIYCMLSNRS